MVLATLSTYYDMDRLAGETQWTDSGSMTTENSTTNNFDSNLVGAWASPGGGGIGPITGPMSSTVVNHNTDSVVSSGPLNDQGGYDLTTIVTSSYDHQNISSYSGTGSYDTIDHEVPISGVISYSRDDTVINTQNLTTTTAPDGTKTVVGNGRSENTHNSTRSANGGGSVSEHTTWQTGPVNDPNQAPWSGSTTHDYWNVRTVIQSYDRAANYSTVDTYGVIGNFYVVVKHDDNSYFFDNNDSTVDVMTRNKTSSLYTRPNGNTTETSESETDSTQHSVSEIHTTNTKTDNKTTDHADSGNNSSERSGERTEANKQTTDTESYILRSITNSSQGSDTYYEEDNDYHSVDEVNGTHTVGSEPADDEGSTTHSGSLRGAYRYRNSPSDALVVYPVVPSQADPTYEVTVEDGDYNAPPVPQPHQTLKLSTPPLTNAGPSASAPSQADNAATDQAISELTQNDEEGGTPYASTAESPVELLADHTGPIGDVGGIGDLGERFPETKAPDAMDPMHARPPILIDCNTGLPVGTYAAGRYAGIVEASRERAADRLAAAIAETDGTIEGMVLRAAQAVRDGDMQLNWDLQAEAVRLINVRDGEDASDWMAGLGISNRVSEALSSGKNAGRNAIRDMAHGGELGRDLAPHAMAGMIGVKSAITAPNSVVGNAAHSAANGAKLNQHLFNSQKYGSAGFKELQNGRIRYFGELTPAGKPGTIVGRRKVYEWDPSTGNTRTWMDNLDAQGRSRIIRPETGGPKVHFQYDENGNFIGTF